MNYLLHLLIYFEIFAIAALSLNLVVGYCGLFTLAHAGFFALGGYVYAIATLAFGLGFMPALGSAILITAGASLLVSVPAWRLKGDFFVITSLAVQALLFAILANWGNASAPLGSWSNMTNGVVGIAGIPRPNLFGLSVGSMHAFVVLATCLATLIALALWRLQNAPWGRVLVAMREDELAARSLGKNTRVLKIQAFAISAAAAAVAGVLFAAYIGYIDPTAAALDQSILMLSMVLIGGAGNLRGPLLGAAFLVALPEILKALDLPDAQAAPMRVAIFGLMLILFMHIRPQGLLGKYRLD